jgi:hypothetical protein
MSYEPPLRISIPLPAEIPIGFGPNSTGRRGGNLRVRVTDAEYDAMQIEAALLDVSLAKFVRWCAVHVAQTLKEHRDNESTDWDYGERN